MAAACIVAALGSHTAEAQVTLRDAQEDAVNKRLGQQLITLISFGTVPGITGGTLDIRREAPAPDYSITKFGIGGDTTIGLEGAPVDLHLEGGVGLLETDENSFEIGSIGGSSVAVKTDRTIATGRVGVGPSIALNDRFRLVPKISLAISHFKNETGLGIVDGGTGSIGEILSQDFELWAATYAGSLQLRYDEEFGRGRAELRATVTGAYTDVVDAPADSLKVSGWTTMTTARARWSEPADFTLFGQPVGWNITSTLTVPSGAGREALGFRFLLGAGGGLDLDLRDRNLPFVQALRPSLSLLIGDNVTGFSVGFGVRF